MIAMVLLWSINLRIVRGWTTEDPPESHYRHCLTKCWHQFQIPAIIVPHNRSCLFSSPPLAKAAVWRQESLRNVKTHFSLRIRHLLELQSWASSPALGSFYRSAANSDNSGVLIVTTTHTFTRPGVNFLLVEYRPYCHSELNSENTYEIFYLIFFLHEMCGITSCGLVGNVTE